MQRKQKSNLVYEKQAGSYFIFLWILINKMNMIPTKKQAGHVYSFTYNQRNKLNISKTIYLITQVLTTIMVVIIIKIMRIMILIINCLLRQFRESLQIKKKNHKCSSSVVVCWIAKIYQSKIVKKGWLFTYHDKGCRSFIGKGAKTWAWWVLSAMEVR